MHIGINQLKTFCSSHDKSESAEEEVLKFHSPSCFYSEIMDNAHVKIFNDLIVFLNAHLDRVEPYRVPLPVGVHHFISSTSRAQTFITSDALFPSSWPSVNSIAYRLGNAQLLLPFFISLSTFESGLADWIRLEKNYLTLKFLVTKTDVKVTVFGQAEVMCE